MPIEERRRAERRGAAEEQEREESAPALLPVPRQWRERERAADERREAVAERQQRPRHRGDLDVPVEEDDQRADGGGIEDDAGVPAALVPRHAASEQPVQQQPVAEDRRQSHHRACLPRQELQRDRAEADGDVDRLAERFVGFVHPER